MRRMTLYLIAARPYQWIKNLVVFAAPLAAGGIKKTEILHETIVAAVLFLFISISVYFFNDVRDIEIDRRHPQKARRPIANGEIPYRHAIWFAFIIASASLTIGFWISSSLGVCLGSYVFINILYSVKLKEIPYLELAFVSSGFVLRATAGGAASGVPVSFWFISLVSCTSLFVVVGKRYAELSKYQTHVSRPVLRFYPLHVLRGSLVISLGLAVITYSFWLGLSENTWSVFSLASLIIFILTMSRYSYQLRQGYGENPVKTLLGDYCLIALSALWVLAYGMAIYG